MTGIISRFSSSASSHNLTKSSLRPKLQQKNSVRAGTVWVLVLWENRMVYILPLEWPCKIPEVYKVPRLWRRVYYSEKTDVPAVTRKSAIGSGEEFVIFERNICYIDIFTNSPSFKHTWFSCVQGCFVSSFVEMTQRFYRILSANFLYFSITGISSWKRDWP